MKTLISDITFGILIVLSFGSMGWFFCNPPKDDCTYASWITFFGVVVVAGILMPIGFQLPARIRTGKWE